MLIPALIVVDVAVWSFVVWFGFRTGCWGPFGRSEPGQPPRFLETWSQTCRREHRACLASIAKLERELGFEPLDGSFSPLEITNAAGELIQSIPAPAPQAYRIVRSGDRTLRYYDDGRVMVTREAAGPMGKYS